MTISRVDSELISKREEYLTYNEIEFVDDILHGIWKNTYYNVPLAKDDRAATFEAAFIRYVIASRKG